MENKQSVLSVSGLHKTFHRDGKKQTAIEKVDFTLYPGEILGIVGESGSGKSTALRCVAGLEKVSGGSLLFDGRSIANEPVRRHCREIQMVFQDAFRSFDPRQRMGQALAEPLREIRGLRGQALEEEAARLMGQVGLAVELLRRYPAELSGGQCQRVAIARALAPQPRLLLCDEITSALDVSAQAQIIRLLLRLREEYSLSILFVTHSLAVAGTLCDRILVMRQGRVVEEGTAGTLFAEPQEDYTRQLVSSILKI